MSTQLNWGASYLINDGYLRFINPHAPKKTSLNISKLTTLTCHFGIAGDQFYGQHRRCVAIHHGMWRRLRACVILRWYWWRINAWTEIAATVALCRICACTQCARLGVPKQLFFTVGFTTAAWVATMYLTTRHRPIHLEFYKTVQPGGAWKPIEMRMDPSEKIEEAHTKAVCLLDLGIGIVYGALFAVVPSSCTRNRNFKA